MGQELSLQRSNISRRTLSGSMSIVIRPTVHSTSQQQSLRVPYKDTDFVIFLSQGPSSLISLRYTSFLSLEGSRHRFEDRSGARKNTLVGGGATAATRQPVCQPSGRNRESRYVKLLPILPHFCALRQFSLRFSYMHAVGHDTFMFSGISSCLETVSAFQEHLG